MKKGRELAASLGITAVAIGMDYASGRAPAAFYGQMGDASWLGVVLSGVVFGLFAGLISALARRTGARSFFDVLRRLPGGGAGRLSMLIYCACLAMAAGMLLASAAHAGELVLPLKHAAWFARALALLLSMWMALAPPAAFRRIGAAMLMVMALCELALIFRGQIPREELLRFELDLQLHNKWIAAAAFSLVHSAACLCICVGVIVRESGPVVRPARLGWWSGCVFALMLGGGNAVLQLHNEKLMGLKTPFAALASEWGSAGFYLIAGLMFGSSLIGLSGIMIALSRTKIAPQGIEK